MHAIGRSQTSQLQCSGGTPKAPASLVLGDLLLRSAMASRLSELEPPPKYLPMGSERRDREPVAQSNRMEVPAPACGMFHIHIGKTALATARAPQTLRHTTTVSNFAESRRLVLETAARSPAGRSALPPRINQQSGAIAKLCAAHGGEPAPQAMPGASAPPAPRRKRESDADPRKHKALEAASGPVP